MYCISEAMKPLEVAEFLKVPQARERHVNVLSHLPDRARYGAQQLRCISKLGSKKGI